MTRTIPSRRLLAAVAALLATAAATALLAGGSSPAGLGPAAALAEAAADTAGVTSGVATARIAVAGSEPVDIVVRFDGRDVEASFDEMSAGGEVRRRVIRAVGGAGFERAPDGSWSALEGEQGNAANTIRSDIADEALFAAVQAAPDVTRDGDVYRATLSADSVAGIDNSLLGLGGVPLADGAAVEVEAGADGLIRRVSVTGGGAQRTVTYSELGEPQGIEAPAVG